MLSRYNLWPIFRANYRNTGAGTTKGQKVLSATFSISVPIIAGLIIGWLSLNGVQIGNGISVALPAVSLLVGAMFGAFVFLTNLRVKLAESETYSFRASLHKLVGSSAAGCLYVAVVALNAAGLLAVVGSVPRLREPDLKPFVVSILVAVFTHVGLSLLIVIRRLFVVYFDIFAADFNPEISSSIANSSRPLAKKSTRSAQPHP